ncbi:sensor histidine kinase [uncultured Methylibium sp.]|uniref:sensor histidine kinase n=1 Tax=uncultured Methylibium sp. TaxID=381093 RepID=UPI0025F0F018|nr:sensor histidine kinase [uncultured Methylibium sp.]
MHHSLRRYLLAWIVGPIALFVVIDTVSLYRSTLRSLHIAYDRTLLASARAIGERLTLKDGRLQVELPYEALEVFEVGNAGRMVWRIDGFDGEFISGYASLPRHVGTVSQRGPYQALVDFVDSQFEGVPVRMAALHQPVAGADGRGIALIQVAETLEVREAQARQILRDTLLRQALLIIVVAAVTAWVVARALRPVDALRGELGARGARDLSPLATRGLPLELQPLVGATNELMQRVARGVAQQRQFVRDASHQLRTPLAVLKLQVQNGLQGHADPRATLAAIGQTVDRAIRLAQQMLALAKVEQVHRESPPEAVNLGEVAAEVALDLAPLVADRAIDFELVAPAEPVPARGHAWMLRELTRNLLHNAIRATPHGGPLSLIVESIGDEARLIVRDSGPGLTPEQRQRLFEPFHTGHPTSGSGLGLAICREVCERVGGDLQLLDREVDGRIVGLDAVAVFRREPPQSPP